MKPMVKGTARSFARPFPGPTVSFGELNKLVLVGLLLNALLAGCATLPRSAPPQELLGEAQIAGLPPEARAFGLGVSEALQADFAKAMVDGKDEEPCDQKEGQPVVCVLILSGGGGYGAYGAGVLNGWSRSGTRPNFKIVTGVSTGALMAPFAFLGSQYDEALKKQFTTVESDDDILKRRSLLRILRSDAVATTGPLLNRIENAITAEVLAKVAAEHVRGRRLYVGTTNMDAQTFVVWNMGAIAASEYSNKLGLFHKILLASASIPVAMAPVFFEVQANGQTYDEMHADGGVQAQFFVPLVSINLPEAIADAQSRGFGFTPTPRMFVIRNSTFKPKPRAVSRNLADIGVRTIKSFTQSMGRSDLAQIYAISQARGTDFHYTEVPEDFAWEAEGVFDGVAMRELYSVGFERAQTADLWASEPPGTFARNIAP